MTYLSVQLEQEITLEFFYIMFLAIPKINVNWTTIFISSEINLDSGTLLECCTKRYPITMSLNATQLLHPAVTLSI